MNTKKLINKLKKVIYVAKLRRLEKKEIDLIEMSAHRLDNYEKATGLFMQARDKKKRSHN